MRRLLVSVACLALLVGCSSTGTAPANSRPALRGTPSGTGAVAATPRSFSFAAAGDLGANKHTAATLRGIDRSDARFFLALGDLDYDQTPTDAAWCAYVRDRLPHDFPFEVLVGNHEQDGGSDGRISRFARCLPDHLQSNVGPGSRYGAEYAFSYPRQHPLAKFIMIAPRLKVAGTAYDYGIGSPHRRWLVRQIGTARARGMWVVVGMHYPCLSTGRAHGCDAGAAILNLLVKQRVDLVLTGHNHIYERSKQLRLSPRTCDRMVPGRYDRACVRDPGRDHRYRKGAGTVFITAGTVGGLEQGVDRSDPDRGYFATTNGRSTGYVQYTVSHSHLGGRFRRTSGDLADSFEIGRR